MSITLNDEQRKLLDDPNFAYVGTVSEDGAPQLTPVWIEYDGEHVVFNTEKTRAKFKNLERDPRVTVAVSDSKNPYRYLEIRGRVAEMTEEGAMESIDRLAKKYMGKDKYPFHKPGDVRVLIKIAPEKVSGMGF